MQSKIASPGKYLLSLLFVVVYGLVLYLLFTWLAGYSQLLAYLGNTALMIVVLLLDEYIFRTMQTGKFFIWLKKEHDSEKTLRSLQSALGYSVSFKTDMYLFYIIVLIASQVIDYNPALVDETFRSFILANSYSILVLIALDMLMKQFAIDKEKVQGVAEKIKEMLAEKQD